MYEKLVKILEYISRVADHIRTTLVDFPVWNKTNEGTSGKSGAKHG